MFLNYSYGQFMLNFQVDARHVIRQHLVDRHRGLYASVTGLLLQLEPRLDAFDYFKFKLIF